MTSIILNILFYIIVCLSLLVACAYIYLWYIFGYWSRKGVECVEKPWFPFGHLLPFILGSRSMALQFHEYYKNIKGSYAGLYMINQPALLLKDPEIIKHVLVKDFNYFCDRGLFIDEQKEPLSGHLFRLTGKRWRHMRSKLSQAFTLGKLKMMFESLEKTSQNLEAHLDDINNLQVDITEFSTKFTADSIASVIFGIETNSFKNSQNAFWIMVCTLLKFNYLRYLVFIFVSFAPNILKILGIKTIYEKSNNQVFSVVKDVIEYREKHKIRRNDFMQLMIELKNKGEINKEDTVDNTVYNENINNTDRLSLNEISASVYSMFFAGFDTAANTIAFCLYYLALNPEIQLKVHEDIDCTLAKYEGRITYESVTDMRYLECVINETLRMHPILGFIQRRTVQDYNMPDSNLIVKEGTILYLSLYGLHHNPDNFPNPEVFDPDRFLPENKVNIRPYTYMPFGEGLRYCIGKRLGILLSTVGVVSFLHKHSVNIGDKTQKQLSFHKMYFPHSPDKPIFLNVSKRTSFN